MTSPCNRCTAVADPKQCDNKNCQKWRQWFVEKWDRLRVAPRLAVETQPKQMEGVCIGGKYYALPHRVDSYLQTDPCSSCLCPRDLCAVPCRIKRDWQAARTDVLS